ncbi:MAG: hypothetical protein M0Z83_03825 [Betaproteobacteria bacterium]|nr:hypothetical protein [Betaproteobacteria bacterium]
MRKLKLNMIFSGLLFLCASAHAAEKPSPLLLPFNKTPLEVRIDPSSVPQMVKEGKIKPLPDAANRLHGSNHQSGINKERVKK